MPATDMTLLQIIGKNIKTFREAKSITQNELAESCNVHRNYILTVEKGERNVSILTLEKIAHGLNVEIGELLSDELF